MVARIKVFEKMAKLHEPPHIKICDFGRFYAIFVKYSCSTVVDYKMNILPRKKGNIFVSVAGVGWKLIIYL
jgi:hypothetical protein